MANSNPNQDGIKRPRGRPKGSKDKLAQSVKAAIEGAYTALDKRSRAKDGVAYLVRVGEDDPKTFLALYGKLVPKDIGVKVEGSVMGRIMEELYGDRDKEQEDVVH